MIKKTMLTVAAATVLASLTIVPADARPRQGNCPDQYSRFVNGYGWVCQPPQRFAQPQYQRPRAYYNDYRQRSTRRAHSERRVASGGSHLVYRGIVAVPIAIPANVRGGGFDARPARQTGHVHKAPPGTGNVVHLTEFDTGQEFCSKYVAGTRFQGWVGSGSSRQAHCK